MPKLVDKNHPALRQTARPIEAVTPEVKKTIEQMRRTLQKTRGVGLAAPQIGDARALFIVNCPPSQNQDPIRLDGKTAALPTLRGLALLNPKLTTWGEDETEEEGCLSLPGIPRVPVTRKTQARAEFLGEDGKPHILEANGFFARILQHETDHLHGILITDYLKQETEAPAPEVQTTTLPNGRTYRITNTQKPFQPGEYPSGGFKICAWEPKLNKGQGAWTYVTTAPSQKDVDIFLHAAKKADQPTPIRRAIHHLIHEISDEEFRNLAASHQNADAETIAEVESTLGPTPNP